MGPIIALGGTPTVKIRRADPDVVGVPAHPTPARGRHGPAVVLGGVGTVVLVLTYALLSWNDRLNQALGAAYPWRLDHVATAELSLAWALRVTLWCAVAWVAAGRQSRHPWRMPAIALGVVGGWTLLAWQSMRSPLMELGVWVPWPGPVPGGAFAPEPWSDLALVVRPGAATPAVLLGAFAVVCWYAHRRARPAVARPGARALAMASAVLAPPIAAAAATAVALQVVRDVYLTPLQRVGTALVSPGVGIALAIAAALLLAGTGRAGWLVLAAVQLALVTPLAQAWWQGGFDNLLGTAALSTLATALAAAIVPTATAIARLEDPGTAPDLPSVPEGADAHDRARA